MSEGVINVMSLENNPKRRLKINFVFAEDIFSEINFPFLLSFCYKRFVNTLCRIKSAWNTKSKHLLFPRRRSLNAQQNLSLTYITLAPFQKFRFRKRKSCDSWTKGENIVHFLLSQKMITMDETWMRKKGGRWKCETTFSINKRLVKCDEMQRSRKIEFPPRQQQKQNQKEWGKRKIPIVKAQG